MFSGSKLPADPDTKYRKRALPEITFDPRGETTVKPVGYIIARIDVVMLDAPVVLGRMYVNLIPVLPIP